MERVIVLNSDYTFLNFVSWQRAIKLICKGKAEIVKESGKKVRTTCYEFVVPKVVRLVELIKSVFRRTVNFSKRNVHIRDNYTCQYCGKESFTIDHIIPRSRGGKTNFENCVAACLDCNNKKDRKTPQEAGMTLMRTPFHPTLKQFTKSRMVKVGLEHILDDLFK